MITSDQRIALYLFLGGIAIFLALDFFVVLRIVLKKISRAAREKQSVYDSRALKIITVALNTLAVACILWAFFVEPYRIEVTSTTIRSAQLAGTGTPFRVVQISDFHIDGNGPNERALPGIVNALEPDLILITGDYLNNAAAAGVLVKLLKALRAKRDGGILAVTGNWEALVDSKRAFEAAGIPMLNDESREFALGNGRSLWVTGVSYDKGLTAATITRLPREDYRIFMYHVLEPNLCEMFSKSGSIDLYLAGHTHGGQVRVPFVGPILTLAPYGRRYAAGHYRIGETDVYVNRGIGMEGGRAPRLRFWCRPEVTVIDLTGP